MMEKILRLENITKEYPGVLALDDVFFDLMKGEVHVLLGENGAGKSTLVKILSGAIKKTNGIIDLFGIRVEIRNPKHARILGIGIIYQELNLISHLSVAENVFLGREFTTSTGIINNQKAIRESQKILDELKVNINSQSLIKELGIAQQQMVEIAKALSLNSRILIMDEPTSALTENETEELFRTIRTLKKQDVAIIYISHRLEELFEIGDRVTILRDGKSVATKLIPETTSEELIKMMVNRELKDHFPRRKSNVGDELLNTANINKSNILKGISFKLYSGEIVGLYGLLGSGRTQLARVIFGADKMDSGQIRVNGMDKKINTPMQAIQNGIGLLTEDRKSQGLVLQLPLMDNINLASLDHLSNFGIVNRKREEELSSKYMSELNIKATDIRQTTKNLSGGNQQKVVLAKWLCSKTNIFLFDEPTRGIDVGAKVEIYELMNKLTEEGCGIIMISSDLPEILGMSDRILVMYQGRITAEFSREEANQEKIVHSALGENYVN